MALVTLLSLPAEDLPGIIIIDEPELGLHPRPSASWRTCCGRLLLPRRSLFPPVGHLGESTNRRDVIVVDRERGQSVFARRDEASLQGWVAEYAMGNCGRRTCSGGVRDQKGADPGGRPDRGSFHQAGAGAGTARSVLIPTIVKTKVTGAKAEKGGSRKHHLRTPPHAARVFPSQDLGRDFEHAPNVSWITCRSTPTIAPWR